MSLPAKIAAIVDATPARIGLRVAALDGGVAYGVREAEVFTQASAIKIPILWALHADAAAGELSLDETLPVDPTNGAGGCGVLQSFVSPATRIALGDLAVLMIVLSDNVATNLLIDRLGFDTVNALIEQKGGGPETRLRRKMIDLAARAAGRENTATPADAVALMRRLEAESEAGDSAALATRRALRLKKESPVTAALPKEFHLATKPGMLNGLRTEWSIVTPPTGRGYAMAIMADGADDAVLEPAFRQIAAAVHAEMS